MFGYYTPVLLLQAFCLYHAYRNRSEQRWYWLIIFIPVVGCAIYLLENFNSRKNIQHIAEGVREVVNTNYRLERLEKNLQFANTHANKINLADAYVAYGRFDEAIKLYTDCAQGFMGDDPALKTKLLHAYFRAGQYDKAVTWGANMEGDKAFKNAEERIGYAWALHYQGNTEEAARVFADMDRTFTNFVHRKEYCKFLVATGKLADAKEKIAEIFHEADHIKGPERRFMRGVLDELRALNRDLERLVKR